MTVHAVNKELILSFLGNIMDPEVPALSITDLGMVRDIHMEGDVIEVSITPTYNGCPATDMIAAQIRMMLSTLGFTRILIKQVLSPAWTTDWMTEEGKRKLQQYGIAPPEKRFSIPEDGVECPRCHSQDTRLVSAFGSTACKALYQCNDCQEPFDYFKCH